jgi:type I restriction enzyme R subunit
MFLTGFDSPGLNTLFVDKNLSYHGLIQAFSRTNRIFGEKKHFGNIVAFRNLENATKEALKTFGKGNELSVILEKSYEEYMQGHQDEITGEKILGYREICSKLLEKFPDPTQITLDKDKKEFVELFGKLRRTEEILKNYDEFSELKPLIHERIKQDMASSFLEIREHINKTKKDKNFENDTTFDGLELEVIVEYLKTDEINLDYILKLIMEKHKNFEDKTKFIEFISRNIKASPENRQREQMIVDFIEKSDLNLFNDYSELLKEFHKYANQLKAVEVKAKVKA